MNNGKYVILILEDDAYLLRQLKEFFEDETKVRFEVIDCLSIYEGKEKWNKRKSSIDVILTDTNMSPNGLTDHEADLTNNGCFSGWFWLKNYILNDQEHPFPIDKIIMLSEYIPLLERFISNNEEYGYKELKIMKEKGHLIKKGDPDNATDKAKNAVKRIVQ